jgi:uncharacterized protein YkwD
MMVLSGGWMLRLAFLVLSILGVQEIEPLPIKTNSADPSSNGLSFERQVLDELNLARLQPKAYAKHLRELREFYSGKIIRIPNEPVGIITQEGVKAMDEAIDFLEKVSPIGPLRWSDGLAKAAQDHARDQAQGGVGHMGSDGSSPIQRMERHGRWQEIAGEAINYGSKTPRSIVIDLIVDDGVKDRGHRKSLFNFDYHLVGVAFGPHAKYRHVAVVDLAGGFTDKSSRSK